MYSWLKRAEISGVKTNKRREGGSKDRLLGCPEKERERERERQRERQRETERDRERDKS